MRAIRGATCLTQDDHVEMRDAVGELLVEMLSRNGLTSDDVVSVLLTATPDLTSDFPAAAARTVGFVDIPLICAQEIDVVGALPKTVRVMMHVDSTVPRASVKHVYLRGAEVLRKDLHS